MESKQLDRTIEVLTKEVTSMTLQIESLKTPMLTSRTNFTITRMRQKKVLSLEMVTNVLEAVIEVLKKLVKMRDNNGGKLPKPRFIKFRIVLSYAGLLWTFAKRIIKLTNNGEA